MSTIVIICIALLGALIFVLGANVTRHRAMRAKSGGDQASMDPADRLFIAIRAHGNASEYVPTLIGLLVVCSFFTEGGGSTYSPSSPSPPASPTRSACCGPRPWRATGRCGTSAPSAPTPPASPSR